MIVESLDLQTTAPSSDTIATLWCWAVLLASSHIVILKLTIHSDSASLELLQSIVSACIAGTNCSNNSFKPHDRLSRRTVCISLTSNIFQDECELFACGIDGVLWSVALTPLGVAVASYKSLGTRIEGKHYGQVSGYSSVHCTISSC
jgi:hypothetical protein